MKKLRFLLCLAVVAFITHSSLAKADNDDSVRLLVYPTNGDDAKIVIGSESYLVPITFEASLGWDDVKDAYHIPPAYASLLEEGRISIYIGCSGASFSIIKRMAQGTH